MAIERKVEGCVAGAFALGAAGFVAWGVIVTALAAMGVADPARLAALIVVIGFVGIALSSSGRDSSGGGGTGSPPFPFDPPPAPTPTMWRGLRELERCRAEGIISEIEYRRARVAILRDIAGSDDPPARPGSRPRGPRLPPPGPPPSPIPPIPPRPPR